MNAQNAELTNEEQDNQEINTQNNKAKEKLSVWVLSFFAHCIVLAMLTLVMIAGAMPKQEDTIIEQHLIAVDTKEEPDPEKKLDVIKKEVDIKAENETELIPQITNEEVNDKFETPNDQIVETPSAEGNELGKIDAPQVGASFMGNIGGAGASGGSFGHRTGRGKTRAVMRGGGTKQTEETVDAALWWLANHQEKDGHWDSGKYEGAGTPETDTAVTGAALLAFLGAGHTDRVGKWKVNVKNAITWLIQAQRPDGSWDARNYSNGICTMAIAEAAGMGCGSEAKKAAEMAVDYLLKEQNNSGCFDYTGPSARDDMSVTGWCIMGLKSALLAGIKEKEIKEAFQKCGNFLDKSNGTNDNTSNSKGEAWYTPGQTGSGAAGGACQAIAMLVRQYIGWERTAPWLEAATQGQVSKIPTAYAGTDIYRVYYSFLTLFQQGGKEWKAWNTPVSKILVDAQRKDGDFKGSWDLNGSHCDKGGRVLYTAFLCLSLEVYYRYKSVMK